MANILMLEKYKGEKDGEHFSVYVATDTKLNRYMSMNLKLRQVGQKVVNDIKNTKWTSLPDDKYKMFKEQLHCVSSQNYLSAEIERKHNTDRSKGISY